MAWKLKKEVKMSRNFTIGKLSKATGVNIETIRYYEKIGLMPKPHRTEGNQRTYAGAHVKKLAFIKHGRELGFPLESIKELLELSEDNNMFHRHVEFIARKNLQEVESRMLRLTGLQEELERMISLCETGKADRCRISRILAYHEDSALSGIDMDVL